MRHCLSSIAMATTAISLLSACAFGPGHPRTWVYGVVNESGALPVEGAAVSLYSGQTVTSKVGCFKLQLSSALPLTLSATAQGYKAFEVPAKFGFYRVVIELEKPGSKHDSSILWREVPQAEVQNATCD